MVLKHNHRHPVAVSPVTGLCQRKNLDVKPFQVWTTTKAWTRAASAARPPFSRTDRDVDVPSQTEPRWSGSDLTGFDRTGLPVKLNSTQSPSSPASPPPIFSQPTIICPSTEQALDLATLQHKPCYHLAQEIQAGEF